MADIEMTDVIQDAVDDAALDSSTADVAVEASTDADTGISDASVSTPGGDESTGEPAEGQPVEGAAVQDEFEKRWGIPARSVTGRENRIPHSRVKQMVTKAEQEAAARITKELETKWATERQPLEAKVQDYEGRLQKVAQFEHVLENDPRTFLGLLAKIPAYKEFFDYVGQLAQRAGTGQEQPQSRVPEGMPEPDQTLADGTKVYSMEGLQKLLQWQAENVEQRVTQQVRQHYAPIEQEWQQQQRIAQVVPVIERQISEARTWPNFNELEPAIVQILKGDPNISLERAYMRAYQDQVIPKMAADRNKIRSEVLAEIQKKPVASSAPTGQVKPGKQAATAGGPRDLEDVISDSLREAGLLN